MSDPRYMPHCRECHAAWWWVDREGRSCGHNAGLYFAAVWGHEWAAVAFMAEAMRVLNNYVEFTVDEIAP
jgi:hypothetical protein